MTRLAYIVFIVSLFSLVNTVFAFEFNGKQWERDNRNLRRLEQLSLKMRGNFHSFAKEHSEDTVIRGEQHILADETISAYARIRHHLDTIAKSWEKSLPERTTVSDQLDGRLKGLVLSLAASTVMIENATTMVECFKGTIWERRLNQGARVRAKWHVSGLFRDVAKNLASRKMRRKLIDAVAYIDQHEKEMESIMTASSNGAVTQLFNIVERSSKLQEIEDQNALGRIGLAFKANFGVLASRLRDGVNLTTHNLSKAFGNLVGKVYLDEPSVSGIMADRVESEMIPILKPGDILLDKTSVKLTDKLIPGYFSHAAMWLGTAEEMEDHRLFDSSDNEYSFNNATEYQEDLMNGHSVLEALRPGTQCNTLGVFLSLDVVCIIRLKEKSRELISEILQKGLFYLGQDYDFNFDLNSSDKVVCSELIYHSYPTSIEWPTGVAMGRPTISPDNLAVLAGPHDVFPFKVVYYHGKGVSYEGEEASNVLWKAMKSEGSLPEATTPFLTNLREAIDGLHP